MNKHRMTKGFGELNQKFLDEQKEVRSGVIGDRQWLSEEDESRINKDAEKPNFGFKDLANTLPRRQQEPQVPQGPVIRWERFLPLRSLKVLLVENDDSTRHLVSALLRNCSYEVNAVASGQEAWKTLEDVTTHIDLVLTEVATPCLSGIGLLCKIMSHKTFKNIPVIMMSSNDSVGVVFTCLSKGAVDFLVKPVRKNELKNLWQHVWRKCHFSSGSGSESVLRAQKSTRWESDEGSDNNNGCSGEDDNGFVSLTIKDGSDNGSGTQSSWTKKTIEVDSSKSLSPWEQLQDLPDSTHAQVIHSKPPIQICEDPNIQDEDPTKVLTSVVNPNKRKYIDIEEDVENLEIGNVELKSDIPDVEPRKETANLIGAISNSANLQKQSLATEYPNDLPRTINIKGNVICDTRQIPSLELSLKRKRDAGDTGSSNREQNVVRRSDLSAFSRYNSTSTANQPRKLNISSCSPLDNSSGAAKTKSMHNLQSTSNSSPNEHSNGNSNNNNDMGSSTDKPTPKATVNLNSSFPFQPVQNNHIPSPESMPGNADIVSIDTNLEKARMQQDVQVQHHHHHYHHHHHHVHKQNPANHEKTEEAPPSGADQEFSSIIIDGKAANLSEWNAGSGSNSGSKGGQKGSNEQNSSSSAVTTRGGGINLPTDNGVAAGNCGSRNGSGVDQNWVKQREAALNKFRQKRKDRCFEKKVRYQSRKKLAEERPRVRGQFVRAVVDEEYKSNDADS